MLSWSSAVMEEVEGDEGVAEDFSCGDSDLVVVVATFLAFVSAVTEEAPSVLSRWFRCWL